MKKFYDQDSDENSTEYPEHHIENELNEIEQMKSDENDIKLDQNTIDALEKMKDLNVGRQMMNEMLERSKNIAERMADLKWQLLEGQERDDLVMKRLIGLCEDIAELRPPTESSTSTDSISTSPKTQNSSD